DAHNRVAVSVGPSGRRSSFSHRLLAFPWCPMFRSFALLIGALAVAVPAASQDKKQPPKKELPRVQYAVPLVAKPGEKQKLALRGKNLDAVKEVKVGGTDDAKVKVLGAKKVPVPNNVPAARVGASGVELDLELRRDAT